MANITDAIVDTIGEPILVLEGDATVALANRAFYEGFEVPAQETLGQRLFDLGNGQWNIPLLRRMLGELQTGREIVRDFRVEHDFERIGRRVMLLTARRLNQEGSERVLLVINDITEREAREERLAGEQELSEKLIDSIREGLVVLTSALTVERVNQSFCDMFEIEPAEAEGHRIYELGNNQWDIPELRTALEEILPQQRAFDDFEVRGDFPDIGKRIMLLNARQLDHMPLILLAIRDETAQRAHSMSQKLMLGELQHRVKNILANVRSVAAATIDRSASLDEFRSAYLPRLQSMSRAQDLLLSGIEGLADLGDIVREELAAHGWPEDGRVRLERQPIGLTRTQAQTFAMVIHELATNAVKHGAFAHPGGRLAVEWSSGHGEIALAWRESGLEDVRPPRRRGFGTEMIEQSIEYVLSGQCELDLREDGLCCRLRFPERHDQEEERE